MSTGNDPRSFALVERVAHLATARIDAAGMAGSVLEVLLPAIDADAGGIYTLQTDELVLLARRGAIETPRELERLALTTMNMTLLAAHAPRQWRPSELSDDTMRALIARGGAEIIASSPLRAAGGQVGLLHVSRSTPRPFDDDQLALLACVAAQLGPGLECAARGTDDAPHRQRELSILQRTATIIGKSLELGTVLEACVSMSEELMGSDTCALFIEDGDEEYLHLAAHRVRAGGMGIIYDSLPKPALQRFRGHAGPFIDRISDVSEPYRSDLIEAGFEMVVSIPLSAKSMLVGLMSLGFRSIRTFSPSTLNTLLALGDQQALAIDRARTHGLANMRARLSHGVRNVAAVALGAGATDEIYDALLDGMVEIAATPDARLLLLDDDGRLDLIRTRGSPPPTPCAFPLRYDDPSVRWLQALSEPREIRRREELPPGSAFERYFEGAALSSWLIVPLRSRGLLLGVLSSPSMQRRRYHAEHHSALSLLGSVAASALDGERLRRAAEQERRRLGQILESLPTPVAVIDAHGRLEQANASVRALLGETVVGLDWQEVVQRMQVTRAGAERSAMGSTTPAAVPAAMEENAVAHVIARAMRSEEPPPTEVRLLGARGWRSMIAQAVALCDETGRVTGVVTAWQDVTTLRELADAKDRFLAMASHELRSPLGSLHAVTSQLLMDPRMLSDDARRQELGRRILRQVDRLARLVSDLHDVERLRDGTLRLDPEDVDLADLARELVEVAAAPSRAHSFRVDAPQVVEGRWDRGRLAQVITNLLTNAVRYSPDGGEVTVTVRSDGQNARLSVRDCGIGIPPAQLRRLFEPGFRGVEAGRLVPGGLGLGLYITQEIVRRHGGRIQVESEPGRGARFEVVLPRDRATVPAPSGPAQQ